MGEFKLTEEEIIEVFKTFQNPMNKKYFDAFEVWEIPPIRKDMQIFFECY